MDRVKKLCAMILCGLLVATTAVPAVSDSIVYADDQNNVVVDEELSKDASADEGTVSGTDEYVIEEDEKTDVTESTEPEVKPGDVINEEPGDVTGDKSKTTPEKRNLAPDTGLKPMDANAYARSTPKSGEVNGLTNNIKFIDWYVNSNGKVYARIEGSLVPYKSLDIAKDVDHFEAWIKNGSTFVWDGTCEKEFAPSITTDAIFEPGDKLTVYFYGAIPDGRCLYGDSNSSETPWTVTVPEIPLNDPDDPNKPDFTDAASLQATNVGLSTANLTWNYVYDNYSAPWADGYYVFVDGVKKYTIGSYYSTYAEISIPYNKSVSVYVRSYYKDSSGKIWAGKFSNTITIKSKTLGKASFSRITKLSSGKACIHVKKPSGATGVIVYKGSKKIKTLKSSAGFKYSAKGAGTAKYKTRAYIVSNGKTYYGPYSSYKKPASNSRSWSKSSKYSARNSFSYATAHFLVSKVYYSKGKLKVSGYMYNARIFKLKATKVKITIYAEGKTITKTVKLKPNLKDFGKKKMTVTMGKYSAYDLRGSHWETKCVTSNWGFGWE